MVVWLCWMMGCMDWFEMCGDDELIRLHLVS